VENKEARVKESRKGIVNMKFESIKICCEKGEEGGQNTKRAAQRGAASLLQR
jgi:hypothetical protein